MREIQLKYGLDTIPIEYDEERFDVVGVAAEGPPMSDIAIGELLDRPIDSAPLDDLIKPGESVLIVVPDATRRTGSGQIVNLVVRRLIASGTAAHDIRIIFATGIHRPVTEEETASIITPFIAQRIKTLDHDPRDLARIVRVGETSGGIPVELNRALIEHDHVIIVGGVTFHYFAGFTGGRKLICPGLASTGTITRTHKLAFDCESKTRRVGVGNARLDGNAVHDAFMEAVAMARPAFAINTIVDGDGAITALFCGDWVSSHRAACEKYAARHTIRVLEKRGLVIVSCGGHPYDINMIQAHKSLESASHICSDGGTIVLIAECPDGMGRPDFLKWFDCGNSDELGELLCERYQVNGQTAWNLLGIAERFDVKIATAIDQNTAQRMRLGKIDVSEVGSMITAKGPTGYIMPAGTMSAVQ